MSPVLYEKYHGKWYILTEDYRLAFTLNELYEGRPDLCQRMVTATGVDANTVLEIVAPKGFVTDLASIPEIFHNVGLTPTGPWEEAATLHDLLYQKKTTEVPYLADPLSQLTLHCNKDFADRLFALGLRRSKVNIVLRKAMQQAVVTYGWGAYADLNTDALYPIPEHIAFNPVRNYLFFRKPGEDAIGKLGDDVTFANVQFPNIKRAFLSVSI